MAKKKRYVARVRVWHSREEREIAPGEPVDVSHLDSEQVRALVAAGVIEEGVKEEKEGEHAGK